MLCKNHDKIEISSWFHVQLVLGVYSRRTEYLVIDFGFWQLRDPYLSCRGIGGQRIPPDDVTKQNHLLVTPSSSVSGHCLEVPVSFQFTRYNSFPFTTRVVNTSAIDNSRMEGKSNGRMAACGWSTYPRIRYRHVTTAGQSQDYNVRFHVLYNGHCLSVCL